MSNALEKVFRRWQTEPTIAENITRWEITPEKPAVEEAFPDDISPVLKQALGRLGINHLYSHQVKAWRAIQNKENLVIVTGTASGKTLCYNLPVLSTLLANPAARALYLFPTKALSNDQFNNLERLSGEINKINPFNAAVAVYDGDTPQSNRSAIRKQARLLLSNPDMLHMAILPHHTLWADFFKQLKYIVIDEIHIYRGVFGSHVANVLRRLQRICKFYGTEPQFILTSATIANPQHLAQTLIEKPVTLLDEDGAPKPARNYLLYNPPIVHKELGIRQSALAECTRLAMDLLSCRAQTILFGKTRRTVELGLISLQRTNPDLKNRIHAYRSGYLAAHRREIERSLREKETLLVVATNALELGIDIGSVECVMLMGYPGTIAAFRQQSGRAGRKGDQAALAVMVASANPLDQYLIKHPEFLLERSPEQALINPDNLLILLHHIRCAAFELPFNQGDGFGGVDPAFTAALLDLLAQSGELHLSNNRFFWMADKYPADKVSLRTVSEKNVVLQVNKLEDDDKPITLGEIDSASALWMVHPGAVYLHEGQTYFVDNLDLENSLAQLSPCSVDYYTETKKSLDIQKQSISIQSETQTVKRFYGDIQVTTQITGYKRLRWLTRENIGDLPLELPPSILNTTGFWFELRSEVVDQLRTSGTWNNDANQYGPAWGRIRNLVRQRDRYTCQVCGLVEQNQSHHVHHKVPFKMFTTPEEANRLDNLITLCPNCHQRAETNVKIRSGLSGLGYALQQLGPLFLMCDTNDIGVFTDPQSPLADGNPIVMIYDQIPAGIGLSESLFSQYTELIQKTFELIKQCDCVEGCPSCVGPFGENGSGGKTETLAILEKLLADG
jgi:DEAD/DEAH box helicase domain-containing protein